MSGGDFNPHMARHMSVEGGTTTTGCTVHDFMKLLKNNALVQERLRDINFNVSTWQNRMNMGTLGQKRHAIRESQAQGSASARTMTRGSEQANFFSNKDDSQYSIYCINIRS